MKINNNGIAKVLEEYGKNATEFISFYAQSQIPIGSISASNMDYYIVCISDDEIIVFTIDIMKNVTAGSVLKMKDVLKVEHKNRLGIIHKIKIHFEEGVFKIIATKFLFGFKEQGANVLEAINKIERKCM